MTKDEGHGKALRIFGLAAIILVFDQISKVFVLNLKESIPVINNIFHITFITNTGAGFGILQGQNMLLVVIAAIVTGAVLFYYNKIPAKASVAFGLLLGGTIGNLIDRIRLGFVVDFLDFRIWPAFNVADSAITIGAILLIIYFWKPEKSLKT